MLACLYLLLSILNTSASVEVRSTHMTTTDGLANNSVCYVFQDSKGFIWMGTLNGLSRYDGNTFVTLLPEGNTQPDASPSPLTTSALSAKTVTVSCGSKPPVNSSTATT